MPAGIRLAIALLAVPAPLMAQAVLDQFSYEGLRLAGVGVDVGVTVPDRLAHDVSAAIRLDGGFFAPRVRPMLSAGYFRSRYNDDEIAELEARLRDVVFDPTGDFSIEVGTVSLTNLTVDLDLQYLFVLTGPVRPYLGVGLGVHLRFVEGAAIDGTFVEDALETTVTGVNASGGFEVGLAPTFALTVEGRGVLASGLQAASLRGGFLIRMPRSRTR